MTEIILCIILDTYLAKAPDEIGDPNQEYTNLINELASKWTKKISQETHHMPADETKAWEEKWWARHNVMVSNDDESARIHAQQANQQPSASGMTVHILYKTPVNMADRFRQYAWAYNSFHVRNWRNDGTPVFEFRSGFNLDGDAGDTQFRENSSKRVIEQSLSLTEHA